MSQEEFGSIDLIVPPGYKYADLLKFIEGSRLAAKCEFLTANEISADEICAGFQKIMNGELGIDDRFALYTAVSMAFFVGAHPENYATRTSMLVEAFRYPEQTLDATQLHKAAQSLWHGLKTDNISSTLNIQQICVLISPNVHAHQNGRSIAICLMWAILNEINDDPPQFFKFQKFATLPVMLANIDYSLLKDREHSLNIYILVQAIAYILNVVVLGDNAIIKQSKEYAEYFKYDKKDLKALYKWLNQLESILERDFCEPRFSTREFVTFGLLGLLRDKFNIDSNDLN